MENCPVSICSDLMTKKQSLELTFTDLFAPTIGKTTKYHYFLYIYDL